MIDFSNDVTDYVAKELRKVYPKITIIGEYVDVPSKFPTVTIEEVTNIPTHLDSSNHNTFASVQYRVQVFSNKENGKRLEARTIYKTVDNILQNLGMFANSFQTTPTVYNSSIYQITAIYPCVMDCNGYIYRK